MLYVCLDMFKPQEIDFESQNLDSASFKGIKLTNILKSITRQASVFNESIKSKIDCLEKLACLSNYGTNFCKRIILDFRLTNEVL